MHTRAHARTHTCACTHTQEAGVQDCSVNTDAVQMRKGRIREARPGAVGGLAGQRQRGVAHRSKSRGGRGWKEDSRLQGREETSQQSAGEGRVCEVPSMLAKDQSERELLAHRPPALSLQPQSKRFAIPG